MVLIVTTTISLLPTPSLHTHMNTHARVNTHEQLNHMHTRIHGNTEKRACARAHTHPNTKHKLTDAHTWDHRHTDSETCTDTPHPHLHENVEYWFGERKLTQTACSFGSDAGWTLSLVW